MTEDRLDFIRDTSINLTETLNINDYPIVMLDLFEKHFSDKYFIHYADFSPKAEVVSNYYPEFDECIILINNSVVRPNLMKRLNFSLAHELGHLVLRHHKYQNDVKNKEHEADEFAAQFLMPEIEITYMPKKLKLLSEYFFVSEIAASLRLEYIKNRKIEYSRKIYNQMYSYRTIEL